MRVCLLVVVHALPSRSIRDRYDIIAEILESARGGAAKTHIMHKANLTYGQMSEYIPRLVEQGFLENCTVEKRGQMKHLLKTTGAGEKLLEHVKSADEFLSSSIFIAPPE